MIPCFDAIRAIAKARDDCVVISTCTPTQYWQEASDKLELDLALPGTMGKASSMGLGIALAQPDKKVVVIDGDGSILMNLGSLVTVAGKAPSNMVHFVFQDNEYYTTGGQPVPGADAFNIADMAAVAGYATCREFDDLEDFVGELPGLLQTQGPVLVCLMVDHPEEVPPFNVKPRETLFTVMNTLASR